MSRQQPFTRERAALALLAVGLGACDDPLLSQQVIEEPRVIAGRAEVVGDEARAWPAPGESLRVRWLVVAPESEVQTSWAFEVCAAGPGLSGPSTCTSEAFARPRQEVLDAGEPSFEFAIPDAASLGDAAQLSVRGVVCVGGRPSGDATSCLGATQELSVALTIGLQTSSGSNRNPSFAASAFTLDGDPWDVPAVTPLQCADLPQISRRALSIGLGLGGGERELLDSVDGGGFTNPNARETVELSWYSTLGKLETPFSYLESDETEPPASRSVRWDPPADVAAPGEVARFFFVMRDFRGGTEWSERALCLTP